MKHRMLRWFDPGRLPPHLDPVMVACARLAQTMDDVLEDGPEKTAGMRKLLEAKDCFIRQKVEDFDRIQSYKTDA